MLEEFDLDAALARKPAILLVDELAHTNAPGSRHPKRYQDVQELLAAGIDVYTTVNVQHLDSLNDIVGGITGIKVRETLPDRVFDDADDVVLVDLTPDDLLQRLKEGKVYFPEQAARAIQNFFRKGNLLALRELSLRRTADRVDTQMRTYRVEHVARAPVWKTRDALLVGVGPDRGDESVVRAAARLAAALDASWHAVYVETPALARASPSRRRAILATLEARAGAGRADGDDRCAGPGVCPGRLRAHAQPRPARARAGGHAAQLPRSVAPRPGLARERAGARPRRRADRPRVVTGKRRRRSRSPASPRSRCGAGTAARLPCRRRRRSSPSRCSTGSSGRTS